MITLPPKQPCKIAYCEYFKKISSASTALFLLWASIYANKLIILGENDSLNALGISLAVVT